MSDITARFKLNYPEFSLDVDLHLPSRGVTALFGHSGSGKTSLLRCIAGLERAEVGHMKFGEEIWQSDSVFIPSHRRPVGYVFQEASLFSHLSARGNLDYAIKRAPPTDHPISLDQAVSLLGIEPLLERHPDKLSGGERQRVAIARALLIQPRLLLMDEPLSALDLPRKLEILPYLERIKQELDLPILYVSHAPDEVARLADHLVAMERGRAIASGTLNDTLSSLEPSLKLGEEAGVVLEGLVIERDETWHLSRVRFPGGELWLRDSGHSVNSPIRVRILARDISLAKQQHADTSILNSLPAIIEAIAADHHPGMLLVKLRLGESALIARITRRSADALALAENQPIWAQIKSVAVI